VEVSNPVCGDVLQLAVHIENERVAEARFLCRGCTTSIACASLLTEQLRGRTLGEARAITAQSYRNYWASFPPRPSTERNWPLMQCKRCCEISPQTIASKSRCELFGEPSSANRRAKYCREPSSASRSSEVSPQHS